MAERKNITLASDVPVPDGFAPVLIDPDAIGPQVVVTACCPHCGGDLSPHADGLRTHCDGCGCCFDLATMAVRPGHPVCTGAA